MKIKALVFIGILAFLSAGVYAQNWRTKFRRGIAVEDTAEFNAPLKHNGKVITEIADVSEIEEGGGDTDSVWVDSTFIPDPKPSSVSILVYDSINDVWEDETLVAIDNDSIVIINEETAELDSILVNDTLWLGYLFISGIEYKTDVEIISSSNLLLGDSIYHIAPHGPNTFILVYDVSVIALGGTSAYTNTGSSYLKTFDSGGSVDTISTIDYTIFAVPAGETGVSNFTVDMDLCAANSAIWIDLYDYDSGDGSALFVTKYLVINTEEY